MTRLPSTLSANASARTAVSGAVRSEGISSTRCMTGTGLKKCRPSTDAGRSVAMASFITGIDDVLLARMASSASTALSSPRKTSSFSASFSITASTTSWRSANSPNSVV
jgi:hypothetical protein